MSAPTIPRIVALAALAALAVVAICTLERGDTASQDNMIDDGAQNIEMLRVEVVERYPHARDAFTQGLLWHDAMLYESTGLEGQSSLRQVDLLSGQVHRRVDLDHSLFGEGLALVGERLIQLTWTNGKALVYRKTDLEKVAEFDYEGEGWGLCHDGERLFMSDGTSTLTIRDPRTFAVIGRVPVTIRGRPQANINELECVGQYIYANIWGYEDIIRIEAETGRVTAIINGTNLLEAKVRRTVDVLNGIAYMPERERFLITGKNWPTLFEVRFVPR